MGDGSFEDVTSIANAGYASDAHGLTSGDFNNDGLPDLYIGSYGNLSCKLLQNQGDGSFTDVTSGSGASGHNDTRTTSFADYNNDGLLDIFSSHHDFSSFNLEFGLGDKTMIDSLIIYWPGGIVDKMYDLAANQFLTITEGSSPLSLIMSPNTMICYGDSVQIYGEVNGGSGNFNFLWSPSTGLSDPTISNTIAFPDTTTTYTLTVDDGINTISDSVSITVFSNLNPEIIAMPNDTAGINDTIILGFDEGYAAYFWQDGSTDSTFKATNYSGPNGGEQVYWVEGIGAAGCTGSDTISVWFLPLTKINENKPGISFEVYPNPAQDKISISLRNFTGNVDVQILTIDGNVVLKSRLKPLRHNYMEEIDISFLPHGVYLLSLKSPDGKIYETRKFVKKS